MNIEDFCVKYNLGTVIDIEKISGGLMHRMFKVKTTTATYTIKVLNGEVMNREDAYNNFVVSEKIMTHGKQYAKTIFDVELNGENSSTHVTSRSVATEDSKQEFVSKIYGNEKSFAHSECDAIIKDNAKVTATPEITANNVEANLIHEAAIGKIAGEQLTKLMTLGLSEKEAEEEIIKGFLR